MALYDDKNPEVRHALHVRDDKRPGKPRYLRTIIHSNGFESIGCITACAECGLLLNVTCSHRSARNGQSLILINDKNPPKCCVCGAVIKDGL